MSIGHASPLEDTISLLYHDVVDGDFSASGRGAVGSDRFKIKKSKFRNHLSTISRECVTEEAIRLDHLVEGRTSRRAVLFTFDDGGIGSMLAADLLEEFGISGHFFITTGDIGDPGFVSESDVAELRDRGHLIGSHSHSHPTRMARLSMEEMYQEWSASRTKLERVLGEEVRVASVPGGYYSKEVGRAAAAAGIRYLFTSEPQSIVGEVDGCVVLGRYSIEDDTASSEIVNLVQGKRGVRMRRAVWWTLKKVAKQAGGRRYLQFRKWVLKFVRAKP